MMPTDDYFGPRLPGVFDFTLLFQQSILSLLPTAAFVLVAPWRIFHLYRRDAVSRGGTMLWCKLVSP